MRVETRFVNLAIDNPGERILCVRNWRGVLFIEVFSDGAAIVESARAGWSGEGDGLIWRLVSAFP